MEYHQWSYPLLHKNFQLDMVYIHIPIPNFRYHHMFLEDTLVRILGRYPADSNGLGDKGGEHLHSDREERLQFFQSMIIYNPSNSLHRFEFYKFLVDSLLDEHSDSPDDPPDNIALLDMDHIEKESEGRLLLCTSLVDTGSLVH